MPPRPPFVRSRMFTLRPEGSHRSLRHTRKTSLRYRGLAKEGRTASSGAPNHFGYTSRNSSDLKVLLRARSTTRRKSSSFLARDMAIGSYVNSLSRTITSPADRAVSRGVREDRAVAKKDIRAVIEHPCDTSGIAVHRHDFRVELEVLQTAGTARIRSWCRSQPRRSCASRIRAGEPRQIGPVVRSTC